MSEYARVRMRRILSGTDTVDTEIAPLEDADLAGLALLFHEAYRGTPDDEGEGPEEALSEIKATLEGQYGTVLWTACGVIRGGDRLLSACIVTLFMGMPLVTYVVTAPDAQRKGLASRLIRHASAALLTKGYRAVELVVTRGTQGESLYRRLGFNEVSVPKVVPKAQPGEKIAVLSPSFAAPAVSAAIHDQAMQRLQQITGLVPVEFPTTRQLGASARDRARDINAAFANPQIKGIISTLGGTDQITVIPHLDVNVIEESPKPFLGYSDNTHLLNFFWSLGIHGYYGGSTQVHLGPGPEVDEIHARSLQAALIQGGMIELFDPGESEDFGVPWEDPRALTQWGTREATEPWEWSGPSKVVEGQTWGGCLEVIDEIALSKRMPSQSDLAGSLLLLETSEECPSVFQVERWVRGLGERGILEVIAAVIVARPVVTTLGGPQLSLKQKQHARESQRQVIMEQVSRYNSQAVICTGVPFGHTRPQWIVPYGGQIRLDGKKRTLVADYGEPERADGAHR